MKRIIFFLIISMSVLACNKDDEGPEQGMIETNTIGKDLQQIIIEEDVERLRACTEGSFCGGASTDYAFPGDNFVRIGNEYFNLNQLVRIETRVTGPGNALWVEMELWFAY